MELVEGSIMKDTSPDECFFCGNKIRGSNFWVAKGVDGPVCPECAEKKGYKDE